MHGSYMEWGVLAGCVQKICGHEVSCTVNFLDTNMDRDITDSSLRIKPGKII